MNKGQIFIVGLGRTGSTLTRTLLNSSDCIGIGGESHYLSDLPRLGFQAQRSVRQRLRKVGDLSTEDGVRKVVDHLFTINERHLYFWNFSERKVDRNQFLNKLMTIDGPERERALFELAMDIHAGGKGISGDKTPAHIFFVPQLLEWFPNAKIVHTFRDPRAIFTSRKKKAENKLSQNNQSFQGRRKAIFQLASSLHVIINWQRVERIHRRYLALYPGQYMMLKYEDLVHNPEGVLESLCGFLGIPFMETMLEQTMINSSYLPDGAVGFDIGSVNRWRKHMDASLQGWFRMWLGTRLNDYGYEG